MRERMGGKIDGKETIEYKPSGSGQRGRNVGSERKG